ncbi:MAG: ABC transporter ATP-binding protein [Crocinitomicaceae bacterium]|nr:ABC transporter ATP-binding protein [Crocinitomicaceae bacterium]
MYLCKTLNYYREIYRYTFKYKGTALIVVLCNLLFVIFNLLSLILFIPVLQLIFRKPEELVVVLRPKFSGNYFAFFDYLKDYYNYWMYELVKHDPKDALFFVCISVLGAFFLKNLFRYGAVWYQSELRMAVVRDVRDALFLKSLELPLSYYSNERKGDLMARMNSDVGEIEVAVVSLLELIFREPLAIIINVASLIYLSPDLTIISFFLLPISAFVISRIGKSLKRTAKKGQEQLGFLFSAMEEGLGGIRIIKAFNAIPQFFINFQSINLRHQKLVTKTFRKRDLSPLLNETLGAAVMLSLVWFGGKMILDADKEALTGEVFLTFVIVFSQLLRPIQSVSNNMANMTKARASQDRINEVLNADEKIIERENAIAVHDFKSEIKFSNVHFKYGDEPVLNDINLTVKKGATIAIVGESGSGKSTMMDLLPRFYDVTSGTIFVDNVDVRDLKIMDLRGLIGIVSQESILFNVSVLENIAFGEANPDLERAKEAAKIANAHNFIIELENAYDTVIGERGNKLSGGQKQRISIARAIYKDPKILILDEATSALDTESEKLVQEALEHLMKNRTSFVIAHRLSTVRNADEIIVLSKGKIVEIGNHTDLMQQQGFYYKYSTLQGLV